MTLPGQGSDADLHNRFVFHPATENSAKIHQEIRDRCFALALSLTDLTPEGRERALMVTKIEEAMFWANAAIARSTTDAT